MDAAKGNAEECGTRGADGWRLFEEGSAQLSAGEHSTAAETLSQALEALVASLGGAQLDRSLGPVYVAYGRALVRVASERQGDTLFGSEALPAVAEDPSAKRPRLIDIADYDDYEFSEGEEEEADADEDAESADEDAPEDADGAEATDDFEIAWEVLDVARLIYQDATDDAGQRALAEVHCELGDVAMETEAFGKAADEYLKAAAVYAAVPEATRDLAAAYFRAGTALDLDGRASEALTPLREARDLIRKAAARLAAEDADSKEPAAPEGAGELSELRALLPEMETKLEEVTATAAQGGTPSVAEELKASVASAAVSAAADLSSLVRKRDK